MSNATNYTVNLSNSSTLVFTTPGYKTFTVGAGIEGITIKAWGGGGGGGKGNGAYGGGAGFSGVTIDVSSGDKYGIFVGDGGEGYKNNETRTGGSASMVSGTPFKGGNGYSGSGGGQASVVWRVSGSVNTIPTDVNQYVVIAGGGGGGGQSSTTVAAIGGAGGGQNGQNANGSNGGRGASGSTGGTGGAGVDGGDPIVEESGKNFTHPTTPGYGGGSASSQHSGGGGGYGGGGAGALLGSVIGGGGGGSSYVNNSLPGAMNILNISGNGRDAGNKGDSQYASGVDAGEGGNFFTRGNVGGTGNAGMIIVIPIVSVGTTGSTNLAVTGNAQIVGELQTGNLIFRTPEGGNTSDIITADEPNADLEIKTILTEGTGATGGAIDISTYAESNNSGNITISTGAIGGTAGDIMISSGGSLEITSTNNILLDAGGYIDTNGTNINTDGGDINMGGGDINNIGTLSVSAITGSLTMAKINTPTSTYSTAQHMQDIFHSAGWTTGGEITEDGINVTVSAGTGLIRQSDSQTATLYFFNWNAYVFLISSLTLNVKTYIGVHYTGGSGVVYQNPSNIWDYNTEFPLGNIFYDGTTVHITDAKHAVGDHANHMIQRMIDVDGFAKGDKGQGLILSSDTSGHIFMTSGVMWYGLMKQTIASIDTDSGGDTFTTYYLDSGSVWQVGDASAVLFPNTKYNPTIGGELVDLSSNKYSVLWWYLEYDGNLIMLYGHGEYDTAVEAEEEAVPSSVPDRIINSGVLLAKLIFQNGEAEPILIQQIFGVDVALNQSTASNHNNLAGLNLGDYKHLTAEEYGFFDTGGTTARVDLSSNTIYADIINNATGGSVNITSTVQIDGNNIGQWVNWDISENYVGYDLSGGGYNKYSRLDQVLYLMFDFTVVDISGDTDVLTFNGLPVQPSDTIGAIRTSTFMVENLTDATYQICRIEIESGSTSFVIRGNFLSTKEYRIIGQIFYAV